MAVTPSSVAVALGLPAPDADTPKFLQWQQWIDDARLLIRARLGDLDELDQDNLDYVVTQAVVAMVRRPDDATRVDVTVDDTSTSRTYSSGTGRVTILPEWWELLSPAEIGRAYSVDTIPDDAGVPFDLETFAATVNVHP